jgi:pantetheine-phosphate adenylyltransferase
MVPSVETTYISSSVVREVAQHGGNLTGLVHPAVAEALVRKFETGTPPSLPEPHRKPRSRRR